MSGAQGAQPQQTKTATVYESVVGGENRTRTDLRSREDVGGIQVDKLEDKLKDPVARGQLPDQINKPDIGVTGTGTGTS